MSLKDTVVVITGASRGIGQAIAARAVQEGCKLGVCGRDAASLKAAVAPWAAVTDVVSTACDVTQEMEVHRFKEEVLVRFGRVDAVVNNAGTAGAVPFLKLTRAEWDRMYLINATSAFLVSQAFLPEMVDAGKGRIVMIASQSSKKGAAYVAAYTAAKHALLGLSRSLAEEFKGKGIKVNAICPGYVDTPMTEKSIQNIVHATKRTAQQARKALEEMNPQKRFIKPEEVADLCMKLIDSDCTHNGEAFDL